MKNKFTIIYGTIASLAIACAVAWFAFSLATAVRDGTEEAQRSFAWLNRETVNASLENGFMSERFIDELTALCKKSRLLSAFMVETPAGAVFLWPDNSRFISIAADGKPAVVSTDVFRKVFSASLDIGDSAAGAVRMTAVINVLQPGAIFSASRNSFMLTLAVLLVTFIVIILYQPSVPVKREGPAQGRGVGPYRKAFSASDTEFSLEPAHRDGYSPAEDALPESDPMEDSGAYPSGMAPEVGAQGEMPHEPPIDESDFFADTAQGGYAGHGSPLDRGEEIRPEGLYSPVTGIGWEQYLGERLDAELVRAASSEQDLALIIVRISGLLHTDLLARKVASMLLEVFSFRDMLFEFGADGFAGILQNVNLDVAMKNAEKMFARIDEALIEMSSDSRIAIGITTRTARLLPAERMIQEASMAAKKAQDEPNLPIVAFRANPEKYRAFVAENGI